MFFNVINFHLFTPRAFLKPGIVLKNLQNFSVRSVAMQYYIHIAFYKLKFRTKIWLKYYIRIAFVLFMCFISCPACPCLCFCVSYNEIKRARPAKLADLRHEFLFKDKFASHKLAMTDWRYDVQICFRQVWSRCITTRVESGGYLGQPSHVVTQKTKWMTSYLSITEERIETKLTNCSSLLCIHILFRNLQAPSTIEKVCTCKVF